MGGLFPLQDEILTPLFSGSKSWRWPEKICEGSLRGRPDWAREGAISFQILGRSHLAREAARGRGNLEP